MRGVPLNPDGTLKIIPIEPDDDGLDPDWIHLPAEERWERIWQLTRFAFEFPNAQNIHYGHTVDRSHVLEDLPRFKRRPNDER
jgi:hypothetical protein